MADSNRKGAFELSDVRQRSLDGFWETAQTNAQSMWFVGGTPAPSLVSRLDLSNDNSTAGVRGSLTVSRGSAGGSGNANYGWISGGSNPYSSIDRITWASDLSTASQRGSLPVTLYSHLGIGNNNYGWTIGGYNTNPSTYVFRIDYSNDTALALTRTQLAAPRTRSSGLTDGTYGWAAGGYDSTAPAQIVTSISRLDFANDMVTQPVRGYLTGTRQGMGSASNNTAGWFVAGTIANAGPIFSTHVDRLIFSTDTIGTVTRSTIANAGADKGGTGNANYGWFGGNNPVSIDGTSVYRLDYMNDSVGLVSRGLMTYFNSQLNMFTGIVNYPQYPGSAAGAANATVNGFGWTAGGGIATASLSIITSIDRVDFANDSVVSSSRGRLTQARTSYQATSNANYGWFGGGIIAAATGATSVERIDFANDLLIPLTRGSLTITRGTHGAAGNSNYGWLVGGTFPGPTSTIDRIDYSNDSALASARAQLTVARLRPNGAGNANYGWFGGGNTPGGSVTTFERVDYVNDLIQATVRTGLVPTTIDGGGAVSNVNYGWYNGTWPTTSMYRLDFANDSANAPARGNFVIAASFMTGSSGNANYGWFMGGSAPAPTAVYSYVQRSDYSNDTVTTLTRGAMSAAKYNAGGASSYVKERQQPFIGGNTNGTFGWFTGGGPFFSTTIVDRIDFSNDSVTASIRGPLTQARIGVASTTDSNYGWVAGDSPGVSAVDRITFANDLATATARANLSFGRGQSAVVSNTTYGWWAGGGVFQSTIDRFEFANDATASVSRGTMGVGRSSHAATGNDNYGWIAGGWTTGSPTPLSSSDRIDFANDGATSLARGPLSIARYGVSATSNNTYGWFSGGLAPTATPTTTSVVDRIDWSSDTVTAVVRASLTGYRYRQGAAGNANYGWHGGGYFSNYVSFIDRIEYSIDNFTAISRGTLSSNRWQMGATSNYVKASPPPNVAQYNIGTTNYFISPTGAGTYGWIAGGQNPGAAPISNVDRINFGNDTASASSRGSLSTTRGSVVNCGINSNNYGWIVSGNQGSFIYVSNLDRIDYSNDVVTAIVRGRLADGKIAHACSSNNFAGWMVGGRDAAAVLSSSIVRMEYSNDDSSLRSRAPISLAIYSAGSTGNQYYGWFSGGNNGSVAISSKFRLSYSNDLVTPLSRGIISSGARDSITGVSNNSYGWNVGGFASISTVDRIDFSNDSINSLVRGSLSRTTYNFAGTGNANYGWIAGGASGGGSTVVDRIDYANDSVTSTTRGPIVSARNGGGGVSNYTK